MNKNKKDNKSVVWIYFSKHDNISARCKLCCKILKHGSNTTNLMQHLQRKHIVHLQSNKSDDKENESIDNIINKNSNEDTSVEVHNSVPSSSYVDSCILQQKVNYKINIYKYTYIYIFFFIYLIYYFNILLLYFLQITQPINEKIEDAFQRINSFKGKYYIQLRIIVKGLK